jgi:peptidoglycan/LPS O-acetylase OafA/YrhL
MREDNSSKDFALEALRGFASLSVLLWHILLGFFPAKAGIFPNFPKAEAVNTSVFFGLINGTSAVVFFFVLSGFVLTRSALVQGDAAPLFRNAIKRWPRLALPVLIAVLGSWLLFSLDLYSFAEAGAVTRSPWLSRFAYAFKVQFPIVFSDAVLQGASGHSSGAIPTTIVACGRCESSSSAASWHSVWRCC